jgi:hypothetical protein
MQFRCDFIILRRAIQILKTSITERGNILLYFQEINSQGITPFHSSIFLDQRWLINDKFMNKETSEMYLKINPLATGNVE